MLLTLLVVAKSAFTADGRRDFYKVLGLPRDCRDRDIDSKWRALSLKYHPDKTQDDEKAAAVYDDVQDAHIALGNPKKRRVYDLYGESGVYVLENKPTELDPVMTLLGQTTDDPQNAMIQRVGKTVPMDLYVDLADFYNGKVVQFNIMRSQMCRCPTEGYACAKCRGRPTKREKIKTQVVVERGAPDGDIFLVRDAGDCSELAGTGDLHVVLHARPSIFTRDGEDLHISINLTLREALFGYKREIDHPSGEKIVIESKEPLIGDHVLRITGKGMPKYLVPDEFGDLIVHSNIEWPRLNGDAIDYLKSLL